MINLSPTAVSSQLGTFLARCGPLEVTFNGVPVTYDLAPHKVAYDLPGLIYMPPAVPRDNGHVRLIGNSYRDSNSSNGKVSSSDYEGVPDKCKLYDQLKLLQNGIRRTYDEAMRIIKEDDARRLIEDRVHGYTLASDYGYALATLIHNGYDHAAGLSLKAGALKVCIKQRSNAADNFRRSAKLYFDAHFYSAAAVMAEIAASIRESIKSKLTDEDDIEFQREQIREDRFFACTYWRHSHWYPHIADADNHIVNGVKILRGIVNGLGAEKDYTDTHADWFLPLAAGWHAQSGQSDDRTKDVIYLAYRELRRMTVLTAERWLEMADAIDSAETLWTKRDVIKEAGKLAGSIREFATGQ